MTVPAYSADFDRYIAGNDAQDPARCCGAITPSDTVAVAIGQHSSYAKRLYIGTTGDVTVVPVSDNRAVPTPVLYKAVPAGVYLNIQVRMVMATGTTASNIVGEAD